jgi:hypothetical protein
MQVFPIEFCRKFDSDIILCYTAYVLKLHAAERSHYPLMQKGLPQRATAHNHRRILKMSETSTKKSSKKVIIAAVILVALIAVFAIAFAIFSPKAQKGAKSITLTVVDDQGAATVYEADTDAEYLSEVFDEIDGLTVEGSESEYGLYIETVNGLTADYSKDGAYWSIYVNGEYGQYGADSQPVADGDEFSLNYEVYNAE